MTNLLDINIILTDTVKYLIDTETKGVRTVQYYVIRINQTKFQDTQKEIIEVKLYYLD